MNLSENDILLLKRCFTLAARGCNYTLPNPLVGALLTNERGEVVAEGWHRAFGKPHAEVEAIAQLPADFDFTTSTLYVSLEPCCHTQKKTPPCTSLIIEKKIPRVVIGTLDPNPNVCGKGISALQAAGILTVLAEDLFSPLQQAINPAFYINQTQNRPLITLKWAESLNGILGDAQQRITISAPYTQFFTHALRAKHQAILVGKNTVLVDKPQLNLRYAIGKDPVIILLDSQAELSPERYFPNRQGIIINQKVHKREGAWQYLQVADTRKWADYVHTLYQEYQIGSILVEGGATVLENILESEVWDYAYRIVSPSVLAIKHPVYAPKKISGVPQYLKTIQQNQIFVFTRPNLHAIEPGILLA